MRKAVLALIVLSFGVVVPAQDGNYEYGRASELKGLTKVYIDAGDNLKNRDKIESELKKAKLGLEFVNSVDDCQFLITFRMTVDHKVVAVNGIMTEPDYPHGRGVVLVAVGSAKPHLVLSFEDIQRTAFERNPLGNFIKEIIKAYKGANGK